MSKEDKVSVNNQNLKVPLLAIMILMLCVAWLAGFFDSKIPPTLIEHENKTPENLITVELTETPVFERFPATVVAKELTIVSSRILSRVNNIFVRAGDSVEQGQLLASLENKEIKAKLLEVDQQVTATLARKAQADKTFSRSKKLYEQELISIEHLDKVKTEQQRLTAQLLANEQRRNQIQAQLSYSIIKSPIAGKIIERFAEPGDVAIPGQQLLSIFNPDTLRVEAYIRESIAISLQEGEAVWVEIPSLDEKIQVKIEEIVPAANVSSRSFLVKAELQGHQNFQPGMYAKMKISSSASKKIVIPKSFIMQTGQLFMVLIWNEDTKSLERRLIRLGKSYEGDRVEVISGLVIGEKLAEVKI